jgi:hypothetical protein
MAPGDSNRRKEESMPRLRLSFAVLSALALSTGCYKTKVRSGPASARQPTHEDRQWFTMGGLVSLSDPAGRECGEDGLAYAETRLSVIDILLDTAIFVGSGVAGTFACDDGADPSEYAACVSAAGTLGSFLLGSRTVSYRCLDRAGGAD